jgi:glyoxylase I family protein
VLTLSTDKSGKILASLTGFLCYIPTTRILTPKNFVTWCSMNTHYIHHVLIAVDDLERARQFYTNVLELQELQRPNFEYPGLWYKIGDGKQELHINVRSDATLRRDKWIDRNDVHFALRVESYRDTLAWLGGKDFRDDVPDNDLKKLQLRPNSPAGYPQIYLLDPDRNIIEFHCEKLE